MKRLLIPLILTLLITSCTPALRDRLVRTGATLIERNDSARLYLIEDGVAFDPGSSVALGTIVTMDGGDLQLTAVPEGVTCATELPEQIECRLGDVTTMTVVYFSGTNVLTAANYRRPGSDVPQVVIGR